MRRILVIACLFTMVLPISAMAVTGLSVGAKIGFANYSGEVLPGSDDVGSGTSYTLLLGVGTLPLFDLELRVGYFEKDFEYSYSAAGNAISTDFKYQDASVTALVKKSVFAPMASPLSLYVGAGMGMHWLNTEIAQALAQGTPPPSQADSPVGMLSTSKPSGQGVIGFKIAVPAFPLQFFGEGSYQVIFASENIKTSEFAGGLMLSF